MKGLHVFNSSRKYLSKATKYCAIFSGIFFMQNFYLYANILSLCKNHKCQRAQGLYNYNLIAFHLVFCQ